MTVQLGSLSLALALVHQASEVSLVPACITGLRSLVPIHIIACLLGFPSRGPSTGRRADVHPEAAKRPAGLARAGKATGSPSAAAAAAAAAAT